ncbi:hypothetical protein AXG93_1054s1490 [Marchantia polymorpha subsp. ruderalis]|uniref:Uncharacterized protein n=1 Tax=Marchantia polymorpha subsp. ruderalis TaxID=1480154 RepID=A0A176WP49_MARPO|nr:hypothetical protein AXG93_1054s1490 [Marchantia polymorpha subsp. ruderalis]
MESVVGQKRSRDEALEALVEDYAPQGKKPCEKLDSVGENCPLAPASDSEDHEHPCLSSTGDLSSKAMMAADEDVTDSKLAYMAETLRSLEEELGVSGDQTDFLMPAASIDELSGTGLVAGWGDVIWSTDDGLAGVNDDVNDVIRSGEKNEKYNPVDIGFLLEASDDELGIPPSPTSEKDQSSELEQETLASESSAEISVKGTDVDTSGNLQDAVSWALEGGGDNMGYDTGIDDWMMGSLDFMIMDGQSAYSTVLPLVEAGIAL